MDDLFERFKAAVKHNSHGTITDVLERCNAVWAWYDNDWHILAEWIAPEDRELVLKERTAELVRRG